MKEITVQELVSLFKSDTEFAVIDPREEGDFIHAHLLGATNLPYSRLELTIEKAVPNRATPIVLVDDLSGPVERAGALLSSMGYTDLQTLGGGITVWHASGLPLFSGVNVPGKAFGEFIEHHLKPPALSAEHLKSRLDAGKPTLIFDTRTPEEHTDYCIPGALLCPNGELSLRALNVIANHEGPVIAHCAGRTRSIIGAQTLIDLGVKQPVFALENGTVGWEAIGAALERGANRPLAATDEGREAGRKAVTALVEKAKIRTIALDNWNKIRTRSSRTLSLFDVRTIEEYSAGHIPGATHVPGGQLVQNIDKHAIVRNSIIVLTDDDGIRAGMAAFWLRRMGIKDVWVLLTGTNNHMEKVAPCKEQSLEGVLPIPGETVVDIRSSLAYRRGHIPGSWYLNRSNLHRDRQNLPDSNPIVLVADDQAYARLTARDLEATGLQTRTLIGGFDSWCERGDDAETGYTRLASPPNDVWYDGAHLENFDDALRENRRYINWEKALIDDIGDDPSVRYL